MSHTQSSRVPHALPTMPTDKFPKALKRGCFVFLKRLFVFEGRKDEFSRSVPYANINSKQQSQHQGSGVGAAPLAHMQSIADFPPHSIPCRAGATPRSVVRHHCLTVLRELKIPVTQTGPLPCQACAQLFGPSNAHSSTKPPGVQRLQGPSQPLMKTPICFFIFVPPRQCSEVREPHAQ